MTPDRGPRARLGEHAAEWGVAVREVLETATSLVAFARRGATDVVLKVVKEEGDEWHSGETLRAFGGRGVARVHEHRAGALLLERLVPGHSLVELALGGGDEEATTILARVIGAMSPDVAAHRAPSVQRWGEGFDRYAATGDRRIAPPLVMLAREIYAALSETQRNPRLLHGDLHHSNVLFDRARGWIAIDPKGVVGEVEYEIGAALRNPREEPSLFTDPGTIERRLERFVSELEVDRDRVVGWAFAQAVLSAIWTIEDGGPAGFLEATIALAGALRPMLPGVG
ncbi:MAG TPA: aminoglycoside phosphotransferase family protein [Gemmatimonadaceae bacterium]